MALRLCPSFNSPLIASSDSVRTTRQIRRCSIRSCIQGPSDSRKLVLEVKEKLEKEYPSLPVGTNGRDDEDMILWFLKDRRFSVAEAVSKLTKAIVSLPIQVTWVNSRKLHVEKLTKLEVSPSNVRTVAGDYRKWRQEFGVSQLSEEAVKAVAQTGKAYVHDFPDVDGRPVLLVVGSKHVPFEFDPSDDEKLCVFLIEKAMSRLPTGKEQILGIVDLRGFRTENVDLKFLTFLFDVFYYYYPKRLAQVLFVDAPFVFKPIWQMVKPLLKSYASLVKFCSADTVRKEYFTPETLPASFRD